MFGIKIDFKIVLIVVLGIGLTLTLIFNKPRVKINEYKAEITELHEKNGKLEGNNEVLVIKNDKLKSVNHLLRDENECLLTEINMNEVELSNTKKNIKRLQYEKWKINRYVSSLNADNVANGLSNYITE